MRTLALLVQAQSPLEVVDPVPWAETEAEAGEAKASVREAASSRPEPDRPRPQAPQATRLAQALALPGHPLVHPNLAQAQRATQAPVWVLPEARSLEQSLAALQQALRDH